MADGVEKYSNERQLSKYKAGINGSDFFGAPNPPPAMTVVDGFPKEVDQKLMAGEAPSGAPFDPWVYRRPNDKM